MNMMLSTADEHEERVKLPDGTSYVTDLDIQTLQRAKGYGETMYDGTTYDVTTYDERSSWFLEDPAGDELEKPPAEEKDPWFLEGPTADKLETLSTEDKPKKLLERKAEAIAKQPQPSAGRKRKRPKPQVPPEGTEKASDQGDVVPTKCREPGCGREFRRLCDRTKHEKTHSRPWKCAVPVCKYHEYGWSTEEELDRHVNDKHSAAPPWYECFYKPCPYKSERESNCKQHMEKAHGWRHVRSKTAGPRVENTRDMMEPWSNGAATNDVMLSADFLGSGLSNGITMADFRDFPGFGNGTVTGDFVLFENDHMPQMNLFPDDYPESGTKEPPISFVNAAAPTDSGYASMGRLNTSSRVGESTPQGVDVAETVYSAAQSVSEDDVEMYTARFADALADFVTSEAGNKIQDPQVVEALVRGLPQLLRAFALRLGSAGSSKTERDVMVFVYKHRK